MNQFVASPTPPESGSLHASAHRQMMKKGILTLIALGLGASALTGCSGMGQSAAPAPVESSASATASATPSESATESTESTDSTSASPEASESVTPDASGTGKVSDEKFTDLIREKTTTAYIMGNNEIVDIAKQTCTAYDEGGNLKTVLGNISQKFLDTTSNVKMDEEAFFGDLAYISGAGVANYCPEHGAQFKSEIDAAVAASKKS